MNFLSWWWGNLGSNARFAICFIGGIVTFITVVSVFGIKGLAILFLAAALCGVIALVYFLFRYWRDQLQKYREYMQTRMDNVAERLRGQR